MLTGILAVITSTIFGSAKDLLSKKIAFQVHGTVSACTSFLFALPWYILLLAIGYFAGLSPFEYAGQFIIFIILRALTDSLAELCKMHALALGEISFIANFFSLTPIFLIFIAPIVTGDLISNLGLLGIAIIVAGTLLLLKAPQENIPWRGVAFAVASAFFMSLNVCLDRLAVQQANPVFSGFMMTLLSAIILYLPMTRINGWLSQIKASSKLLTIRGLFEVLFMTIKLLGLQYIEPQYAAGIQKLTLVFSVGIGGKAFDEHDKLKRFLASLLIVIGSMLIVYSKITQ